MFSEINCVLAPLQGKVNVSCYSDPVEIMDFVLGQRIPLSTGVTVTPAGMEKRVLSVSTPSYKK